jgi:hypothetical protein
MDLDAAAPTATRVSNYPSEVGIAPKRVVTDAPLVFSHDARHIAVVASWGPGDEDPGNFGLFVVSRNGADTVRLLTTPDAAQDAVADAVSPRWFNGGIAVMGDLLVDGRNDLYYVDDLTTADQDPAAVRITSGVGGGNVEHFAVVP